MTDLVEFLLARIAEDEAVARDAIGWNEGVTDWADDGEPDWIHIARHDPARVLEDCEAKRRIVTDIGVVVLEPFGVRWPEGYKEALEHTLRLLALPYADHPDYDEAWRP